MRISPPFSVAKVSSVLSPSRSATRRSASKCNKFYRQVGALSLISTPHLVHRVEHFHAVRLGAVLSSLHVALKPRRLGLGELMLTCCLLSWAGQRAPIYPLYTTCRSLNCHVVPALAASFLASYVALGERVGASDARWGSTKDQTAPGGPSLLCRALRPTTGISHVFANGYHRVWT